MDRCIMTLFYVLFTFLLSSSGSRETVGKIEMVAVQDQEVVRIHCYLALCPSTIYKWANMDRQWGETTRLPPAMGPVHY